MTSIVLHISIQSLPFSPLSSCVPSTFFVHGLLGFVSSTQMPWAFVPRARFASGVYILLRSDVCESGMSPHRRGKVVKLHIWLVM